MPVDKIYVDEMLMIVGSTSVDKINEEKNVGRNNE